MAISAKKSLILLREEGVEIPGLQGDLEYIPFNSTNPAAIFSKLSEMINDLLARAAGREVSIEIIDRQEKVEAVAEVPEPEQEKGLVADQEEGTDIVARYFELQAAAEKRDLSAMLGAWKRGRQLILNKEAGDIELVVWDCLYFERRYEVGAPDGLDELRRLQKENPDRPEPAALIAKILSSANEYGEAANLYMYAAKLVKDNHRARYLVSAAKQFSHLKRFAEGLEAAETSLCLATGDVRSEAVVVIYELLRDSGQLHFAYARAEAFLHENPQLRVRFDLGLDYRRHDSKSLALYHFKFLHERNQDESGALHNLALLYEDCGLPILSVRHYKESIKLGNTLSAANLGFTYLEAGMVDEAKTVIQEAIEIEEHEARVEACLAEILEKAENEKPKEIDLLNEAANDRDFLVAMGTALQAIRPEITGLWKFPFGKLTIVRDGNAVHGTGETKTENLNSFAALFGSTASPQKIVKVERHNLEGTLTGAVCKFDLTINERDESTYPSIGSILGGPSPKSGFILFSGDSKSGTYVELENEKLRERQKIERVEK